MVCRNLPTALRVKIIKLANPPKMEQKCGLLHEHADALHENQLKRHNQCNQAANGKA
jgi:hypothetical protein